MFTKEEKKTLNQRFWSQFNDFCDTIPELVWRKKKWILHDTKINSNNQEVSRIYIEKKGIDHQKTSDWPLIYGFLAKNMLQLQDNFLEIQEALKEEVNILYRED